MDLITSLTSQVVNKALDGLSMRHKALASNLANVDTPNYNRRDVSFEDTLKKAIQDTRAPFSGKTRQASNDEELPMNATRKEHFDFGGTASSVSEVQPETTESEDMQFRNDGNAVDVETEMVQLAKNTGHYTALSNLEGRRMRSLKNVINSGGGS